MRQHPPPKTKHKKHTKNKNKTKTKQPADLKLDKPRQGDRLGEERRGVTEPPLEGLVVDSVDDVADGHTGLLGRARGLPWQLAKVLEKKNHVHENKNRSAENSQKTQKQEPV